MEKKPPTTQRKRRVRHRRCKLCGVAGTPDAPISSRGKCAPCGEAALAENIRQQAAKSGPLYEASLRGQLNALIQATGGDVPPQTLDKLRKGTRHLRAV